MDSSHDDTSSDERGTSMNTNNNEDKKIYHRHSNHQIQRLEAYFKECPHPDDSQRRKLGEELKLKPKQIKFWFQNKRTQVKTQNEKADNASLRAENLRIKRENEAMQEALKTVVCPPCGGPRLGKEERERNLQKLRFDNIRLKQEYEKLSSYLANNGGHSIASVDSLTSHHGSLHGPSSYGSTSNHRSASYGTSSNHILEPPSILRVPYPREHINITQPPQQRNPLQVQHFQPLSQMEKMMMSEMGAKAVEEVMRLINIEEPVWTKSSIDGRLIIDEGSYEKLFAKTSPFKVPNARPESSRDVVVVQMDARNLVDMFLDTEKWARLFPTIVNESKTIHVLESMDSPRLNFSKVMYEELHILSPLVPSREFIILRSCQQMEEDLWVIADVSVRLPNIDFTLACSKCPSGCVIQALPDGRSKVTWMEHVEVCDKVLKIHRLYRDLFYSGSGYGASRWTVTLERMCERLSLASISVFPTTDYGGVVKTIEGRRSVMNLGGRMLKNFAWILKMAEKTDFSKLSEVNISGVRVSVRTNAEAGQPPGFIVCAASSLSLPLSPLQVYSFLQNLDIRHQWDVLCHGNPVTQVARFVTGTDQNNSVTILQPSSSTEASEMMILQDGFIDALGGMVVYAPVDLNTAYSAVSGQVDPSTIPVLPSGFIISRDGRPSAAELGGVQDNCTTLLTVAFQLMVSGPSYTRELNLQESVATVNTLISSTVQRVKAMLNCNDGQ